MAEGFIGLHRQIRDHWVYQDAEYLKVWVEILFCARFSKDPETKMMDGKLVTTEYSHFIFGRISWSNNLGISERRLRTLFERMIREDMIRMVERHRKFTIYSVVNLEKYRISSPESRRNLAEISPKSDHQSDQQHAHAGQGEMDFGNQQDDSQTTSKRPADDQQATTKEQSKQRKQGKQSNKDIIYPPEFELFWEAYPRKVEKPRAIKSWKALMGKKVDPNDLISCAMNYDAYCTYNQTEEKYIKHPATFLNNNSYEEYKAPFLIHNKPQASGGHKNQKPVLPIVQNSETTTPLTPEEQAELEALKARLRNKGQAL